MFPLREINGPFSAGVTELTNAIHSIAFLWYEKCSDKMMYMESLFSLPVCSNIMLADDIVTNVTAFVTI